MLNNFFLIKTTGGNYYRWKTNLSFHHVKELIGGHNFVEINNDQDVKTSLNTKAIETIEDITKHERKLHDEIKKSREDRLKIVREIRSIPLSKWNQFRLRLNQKDTTTYTHEEKHDIGLDVDPLMRYNESYLNSLLVKCKKRTLK